MIASAVRPTEINPAKLAFLFKKQFELSKVKPGETIVCVSDLATRREYVEAAFAAAEALGGDIYEICVNSIPSWTKVGVPTIGKCKGTLDAVKAADLVVIFHVPLFTKWLKEVDGWWDARTDDHRCARRSRAADGSARAQGSAQICRAALSHDARGPGRFGCRDRLHLHLRRVSGDDPMGLRRRTRPLRPLGRRTHPHLPERRLFAKGTVVIQPGDIVILPFCRYVQDPIRLKIENGFITSLEGGLDAKLMRDWAGRGQGQCSTIAIPERRLFASRSGGSQSAWPVVTAWR